MLSGLTKSPSGRTYSEAFASSAAFASSHFLRATASSFI